MPQTNGPVDKTLRFLDQIFGASTRFAAFISGVALLWLMGLTVIAVVMRYVFNAPILGAQDLSQVSLVLVVFPAMAYCGWTGGHVALDLISAAIKSSTLRWTDMIIHATSALLFVFISRQAWSRGVDALKYGEATNLIDIPHAPFFFVIAMSCGLYAAVLFIQTVKTAIGRPRAKEQ